MSNPREKEDQFRKDMGLLPGDPAIPLPGEQDARDFEDEPEEEDNEQTLGDWLNDTSPPGIEPIPWDELPW